MASVNRASALKLETAAGICCVIVGCAISVLALQIQFDPNELVGSRTVPLSIGILIVVLGALMPVIPFLKGRRVSEIAISEDFIPSTLIPFHTNEAIHVVKIMGCGIAYTGLFWAVGYFAATLISLGITLFAFGNRKATPLLLTSIIGAIAYQFIFMRLLGLDDPAGAIVNLSKLTQFFPGY